MKKVLICLVFVCTMISAAMAQTPPFTVDTLVYSITSTSPNTVSLIDGKGATGELNIPATVKSGGIVYSVTSIGAQAFYNRSDLTGPLVIPNSVKTIGGGAFAQCSGLTSISLPDSMTSIAVGIFAGCSGLTGPLILPDSVTSIGAYAFSDCSGLTGPLVIPNSVKIIGAEAFYECSGLIGPLIIPNSVTSIGAGAFAHCILTSVSIPDSVTNIEERAFLYSSLTGPLVIPNSVTHIGSYAFSGGSDLTSVAVSWPTPPSIDVTAFAENARKTMGIRESLKTLYVISPGVKTDYATAEVWKGFNAITSAYAIQYDLAGGTVSNPASYAEETADLTLENPIREGHTFTGWTGSNGDTAQTTVKIVKGSTGGKSYTANWAELETENE